MRGSKVGAAVFGVAAAVLLVLSVIERDAGVLWMPGMHVLGWALLMVAVALLTYTPEDAEAARAKLDAEAAQQSETEKGT